MRSGSRRAERDVADIDSYEVKRGDHRTLGRRHKGTTHSGRTYGLASAAWHEPASSNRHHRLPNVFAEGSSWELRATAGREDAGSRS